MHGEKTWSFSAGLGSSSAWNLIGITREFPISDHIAVFATAGLGEMILGGGVAYYANRDGDGLVASAVTGTGLQFTLTYRKHMGKFDFLTVGGSYVSVFGFSDVDNPAFLPVVAYEHRF